MKIIKAIKAWYGYADAQRAKDAAYDARPDVYDIRKRLLPDVKSYNTIDGSAAACLCGFGSWASSRDSMVGHEMKHNCFGPKHGGLHREEDFPMRNNAMLVVHRAASK